MTSPNTGLRRTALVVLAVGTAVGLSACGAGQVSQTANQVAAVDGGQGSAGELHVNDLVVVLPEEGEARLGFAASFTGTGMGESISLDRIEIDGTQADLGETQPLERGCSLIVSPAADVEPVPPRDDLCVERSTATLPDSDDLRIGTSVPATVSFSNGDQIEMAAAVIAEVPPSDEYTRPVEIHSDGH
ncbi:hypothetical protein H483_0110955 [Dietzia sp. UCD-THP]|uniref:Secreted protein n=1 Tax=Dietzia natronolimnaea TaxID=161920 RepID=A0A2A2WLY9_9ACTN|nr:MULTISPECIES: hypothetical protein [Dietzia]EYT62383.1 hypothetical protein H483_0110955 [Dietzia sp. UCD-THP]PAY22226.1 hypothetical protein CEY15_14735 [Dietzia natronolimnaea]